MSGTTATVVDTVDSVTDRVPLTLALIAVTTLLLLFAMTGSIVTPIKALLVNLLSLTATFGSLVWIFQDGHLADLLNVTPNGRLDVFTPILMLCVAFGLSMDYEVFLLARIKESYRPDGRQPDVDRRRARPHRPCGERCGRSARGGVRCDHDVGSHDREDVWLRPGGRDPRRQAFLIRGTLVPAMMRVAGNTNWWAPRPLRRLHLRWGLWEPRVAADGLDVIRSGSDVVVQQLAPSSSFAGCTPSDIRIVARRTVHVSAVAPGPSYPGSPKPVMRSSCCCMAKSPRS